MADVKISALPAATTPLTGAEVLPIVQSSTTKQVAVSNLTAGRAVSATSINFGQTTLSYYGEGTFTPTVGGTATYSNQAGKYTRVGRFVWCDVNLAITTIGTGSATTVSSMPFTLGASPDGNGAVGRFTSLATTIISATAQWGASSATVTFMTQGILTTDSTTNNSILGSGTTIRFSVAGSV